MCDRCGQQYLRKDLTDQIIDQKATGIMVCFVCLDEDQPQLQLGRYPVDDPQAIRNPRPDLAMTESRGLFSWDPVGWPGLFPAVVAQGYVGKVRIS